MGFYFHQAFKYIGQSKLTIIALGLAVSMVAGFGYYYDSAQNFTLNDSYTDFIDFSVDYGANLEPSLDLAIPEEGFEIQNLFNNSDFNYQDEFFIHYLSSSSCKLQYINEDNETKVDVPIWVFSNLDLYQSSRFSEYYQLIDGTIPKAPEEFLVSEKLVEKYNVSIGVNQSLTYQIDIETKNITGLNIVGIYSPLYEDKTFGKRDGSSRVFLMFGFNNLEESYDYYPYKSLIDTLEDNPEVNKYSNYGFTIIPTFNILYNREGINIAFLKIASTNIESDLYKIAIHFPNGITLDNYLTPALKDQYDSQSDLRLKVQITNIPIAIFAVYLGSIANKSKVRKRYHEFFSMRMRGFPKSMVVYQFIIEAFLNSILISIVGLFAGIGIFKFGQYWLNPISLPDYNIQGLSLPFHFSILTILETLGFSIVLTLLSTISSIRHITSMKTSKLVSELAKSGDDLDYDETTLYIEKYKEEKEIEREQDKLNINDFIKKKESLIPKWGLKVALISLLPIMLYLIILIEQIFIVPDYFIEISKFLQNQGEFLVILTLICPFILVISLLHYLLIESPSRLANIAKKISHPFMKKRDFIIGIEMVRQKQYVRIILLSSIFIASLIFSNMTVNTLVRQNNIITNYKVGADVQYSYIVTGNEFSDTTDLDKFEEELNQIKISDENFLFDEITHVYQTKQILGTLSNYNFFVNFTEYLSILEHNSKKLPTDDLIDEINNAIEFNNNLSSDHAGIIVSSSFLENNGYFLGDTVIIHHTSSVNFTSGRNIEKYISAKIIGVIDLMPGLYMDEKNRDSFVAIDNHVFNYSREVFPSKEIIELININSDVDITDENIQNYIANSTTYSFTNYEYNFYNYNWDLVDSSSFNSLSVPFIGIFYFNILIIGLILTVGISILVFSAQDESKAMYGELIVRGFGKRGIYALISNQILVSFIISIIVGTISGTIMSFAFSKVYLLSLGGGILNLPVYFNIIEFLVIIGIVISFTWLFLIIAFIRYSRQEISHLLEDD